MSALIFSFIIPPMKKRIVILSAFLSPFRSGAEACGEEVPAYLKDQYDFTIITARLNKKLPAKDQINGIPVIRTGFGIFWIDKWMYPFLAPLAAKKLKPDIIHAVLETFAGLALHFCRYLIPSAKRLLTLQTTNRKFLKKMIVKSPHRISAISSKMRQIAFDYGRKEVDLIPNGIPVKIIKQATESNSKVAGRILFAGRLEAMKGVDTLLNAFAELIKISDKENDYHLRIAGQGSQLRLLQKLTADLNLETKVTFAGFVPVPQIFAEFAQAQVFCGLSRREALGNVFIEAQAAGCAVIGTNVDGIPDIITNSENGLLVEPDNPSDAAKALQKVLKDQDYRNRLTESGLRNAAKYDWGNIAQLYKSAYEKL